MNWYYVNRLIVWLNCIIFFFKLLSDIFSIHKTHSVIQPIIFDGTNQREILSSTRQTVNQFQCIHCHPIQYKRHITVLIYYNDSVLKRMFEWNINTLLPSVTVFSFVYSSNMLYTQFFFYMVEWVWIANFDSCLCQFLRISFRMGNTRATSFWCTHIWTRRLLLIYF